MRRRPLLDRLITYTVLAAGAIIFAFPFIWLISTSFKVEKELYRGAMVIVPEQPNARLRSPYFDPQQFAGTDFDQPQWETLRPLLREKLREAKVDHRADNPDEIIEIGAIGLFGQLIKRTPNSIWTGPPEELIKFAAMDITPQRVAEVAKLAHRELALGSVVVFDSDLHSVQFTEAGVNNWKNLNPAVATERIEKDVGIDVTKISYDFAKGDQFVLTQEFDLPFPAEKLQRLRFRHRADDTWHAMTLSIEAAGVRYVAERANNLQDLRWITATFQKPSADDESTKMKKWLVIYPKETGAQFNHGPNRIRIVLDFKQRSHTEASFAKAKYNYQRVLEHIPFWRYVRVSILLVILNIVLTLFSSSIVAYAFSRLQWPGRDLAFVIMLGTMMIPAQVTMIPNFLIWKSVGAYNTLTPLWAGAVFGNAFFIFLMRQFLKGVPADLEDAARIDGCGFLRIYWHVMLPLVKPSLAAIAIFTFMGTWNDFLGPLMFVADQRLYPLAFGLYAFAVQVDSNAVMTMAASVLMTLPVIVVFFLTQRYFVQGITLTGMKG